MQSKKPSNTVPFPVRGPVQTSLFQGDDLHADTSLNEPHKDALNGAELFADIEVRHSPLPRSAASGHLWLCLRFPLLPLEVLSAEAGRPCAVIHNEGNNVQVLLANDAAQAAGVQPGLPVNAALALAPELQLLQREQQLENEALQSLAAWAVGFTPVVSVAADDALLLEVRGSLQLFGGLGALLSQLHDELYEHEVCTASSPVPQAALWLAASGGSLHLRTADDPQLKALPVSVLNWPVRLHKQFVSMGVETLGDCLRLPRAGFAKRFGQKRLRELDRGFGRDADVRLHYAEPPVFEDHVDLPEETIDYGMLSSVIDLQLDRLQEFMTGRQLAVEHLCITLVHSRQFADQQEPAVTDIEIGLLEPQHSVQTLRKLIELRFERVLLESPVQSVGMSAGAFNALQAGTAALLTDDLANGNDNRAGSRLIERLQARLGRERVYGLSAACDYRPERAWRKTEPLTASGAPRNNLPRPLWLLPQPRRIHGGETLAASGNAERIEAGWWDGGDVQRDYYVVEHAAGRRIWLFRDRSGWYLHGLFG